MKIFRIIILLSAMLFFRGDAFSQNFVSEELLLFGQKDTTPGPGPALSLHGLYSRYLSSQDGNTCTFTPSCSRYASHAIRKKGVFAGVLMTTDRLCRCNPYNRSWYMVNQENGYHEDRVE